MPPASVWLAAWLLVGPPAAAFAYALAGGGAMYGQTGLVGLACGVTLAVGLVRGSPAAVDVGSVYPGFVGAAAVVLAIGVVAVDASKWTSLAPAAGVVGWAVGVAALLHWPETRRWCGLLPAPEDDG